MEVKIRLARHGAKKKPFYRVVVATKECRRDGKNLEIVGTYNPMIDPVKISLHKERIKYWLGVGAIPTDTVKSILKNEGFYAKEA
ncbi:MAG: 30S ribosomal protein S16 [Desulfobacterales bacterium]|nr:30S ribosomal protein S16 [Desulfobacterales bacterium]MBF0396717.1 30S ribosomal protein S16 [Desulfobacterales bacterium]